MRDSPLRDCRMHPTLCDPVPSDREALQGSFRHHLCSRILRDLNHESLSSGNSALSGNPARAALLDMREVLDPRLSESLVRGFGYGVPEGLSREAENTADATDTTPDLMGQQLTMNT